MALLHSRCHVRQGGGVQARRSCPGALPPRQSARRRSPACLDATVQSEDMLAAISRCATAACARRTSQSRAILQRQPHGASQSDLARKPVRRSCGSAASSRSGPAARRAAAAGAGSCSCPNSHKKQCSFSPFGNLGVITSAAAAEHPLSWALQVLLGCEAAAAWVAGPAAAAVGTAFRACSSLAWQCREKSREQCEFVCVA